MKNKILITWLGSADLKGIESLDNCGPIFQALQQRQYDECYILSNYNDGDKYLEFVRNKVNIEINIQKVSLSSPVDYAEIYKVAKSAVAKLANKNNELTFHLSPGTPAMSAVWLILSQTLFPAKLIDSSKEHGVKNVDFPFDLHADFINAKSANIDEEILRVTQNIVIDEKAFEKIMYRSTQMKELMRKAQKVANHNVPVLINGESGTGKELLAQAIHNASGRKNEPFIAVNCGAIPKELFESEFFGYVKGAFTGANQDKIGYLELSKNGTLFLDEIGELPLNAQVKLLRALQEKTIMKVGGTKSIKIDFRIIAATNKNLMLEVAEQRFREDLFHRLAVGVLKLPALRDRKEDLTLLIDYFLKQANKEFANFANKTLSVKARKNLLNHTWFGNVRELMNTITRIVLWSNKNIISAEDVESAIFIMPQNSAENAILEKNLGDGFEIEDIIKTVTKHYLHRALDEAGDNRSKAAKLLGLKNYQTFNNWLRNC